MRTPDEEQLARVEELATLLEALPASEAAAELAKLSATGEPDTILDMVRSWLSLPPRRLPLGAGDILGSAFTLKERLGEGAMGAVWRAQQGMIARDVAVKMIHRSLAYPAARKKFESEMEILGKLGHPGIVQIYYAGLHEQPGISSIPYFAMELVEGQPLNRWLAAAPGGWIARLRIAAAICAAVQSAHDCGILHRDLKPTNILIRPNGQPVILDFGIARLAGKVPDGEAGRFSGTPEYAAPEQHLGRDHDFRSGESVDVYAVGAILFEMLAGRRLWVFERGTPVAAKRRAVIEQPQARLADLIPDCPKVLDEITAKAIRRDPADRYYSMSEFGRAIARAIAELSPSEASVPPWSPEEDAAVPGTNWKLIRKIGEGGTGQVWLGANLHTGGQRVFKFCDTEEKARTLKRELTLFRLLKEQIGQDPHFIKLHEVSLAEPPYYLMMEYTEALDLEQWCKNQPGGLTGLAQKTRLEIIAQTADGLQAAHDAGIIHRDIKPANILVKASVAETGIQVLIADFGIGQIAAEKLLGGGTRLGFTRTVTPSLTDLQRPDFSGTMLYMAPETQTASGATARSDIYSLGVVLWQLLVGDLNKPLDATDWALQVGDPLLQEDLARCLAGVPAKRWSSAAELARSLRELPSRRESAQRRLEANKARERAAFIRGLVLAGGVALGVLCGISWLAWIARSESRHATQANGETALQQALTWRVTDTKSGRRARGLHRLEIAAKTVTNGPALRTAAAGVLELPDLIRADPPAPPARAAAPALTAASKDETCRTVSDSGHWAAIAHDRDGVSGYVELISIGGTNAAGVLERKEFPWMPVAEPGLLRFSPDENLLAVGGAATSRHLLLFETATKKLRSYIFEGADALACAWHPGGRIVATACSDGTVRLWDTAAAAPAARRASPLQNQLDLPPALEVPALDLPVHILRGHRGQVKQVAFSNNGLWMASLDAAGYLRIYSGFSAEGLPGLPPANQAGEILPGLFVPEPPLAVEVKIESPDQVLSIEAVDDYILLHRDRGGTESYRLMTGHLPAESYLAPGIVQMAWNTGGTDLAAITPTDIHWMHASPLAVHQTLQGRNPMGIAWLNTAQLWVIATDSVLAFRPQLVTNRLGQNEVPWQFNIPRHSDRSARTALAGDGLGRAALYSARTIYFSAEAQPPGEKSSLTLKDANDTLKTIAWDQTGKLLGAAFTQSSGTLRVESWATSLAFPPVCRPLPFTNAVCDQIAPANDGTHWICRSQKSGIFSFDPATGSQTSIDNSDEAKQDAPIAVTARGDVLAMVYDRGSIRLISLANHAVLANLNSQHFSSLAVLAWDSAGNQLASATADGYVQVWNLASWKEWIASHRLNE